MRKIQKYYDNTENNPPSKNIVKFINLKTPQGKAIELGCGAGRDTIYLIKNNWNVLAIDREDVEDRIKSRLGEQEYLERFRFQKQDFENLVLEENDLVVANYSLSFCNKNQFQELWNTIKNSILKNGYFVGNFFGVNDEWNGLKNDMVFLNKEQVMELFEDFELLEFEEDEGNRKNGMGVMKHWHLFWVVARKKNKF